MPDEGDEIVAYCGKCNRETTWIFKCFGGLLDGLAGNISCFWVCHSCGTRRQTLEVVMPEEGDTKKAFCEKCDQTTTWSFKCFGGLLAGLTFNIKCYWICLGCGTRTRN